MNILQTMLILTLLSAVIFGYQDIGLATGSKKILYIYDLTYTLRLDRNDPKQRRRIWDETHFITSVQGIVNRKSPRLYVYLTGSNGYIDRFWLSKLREPGEWLSDYELQPLPDIQSVVKTFRADIKGLVVYDENVPATSNVASTIAGVSDLACVRFDQSRDSLYYQLAIDPKGPKIPVKAWLVNKDGSSIFTGKGTIPGSKTLSTGSAKCDAYIWAKERFIDTGRCNPTKMAYYIDAYWLQKPEGEIPNHTLTNHDYFIANKAFFFDLSPWDDEVPNDDPTQPLGTDPSTLKTILRAAYEQFKGKSLIHIGGFVPWDKKYTYHAGGKHQDVESEWRFVEIVSCFNAYLDADALSVGHMANASVFQHYPLSDYYPQKLPTIEDLKAKGYILPNGTVAPKTYIYIYIGDYDSAAWLYRHLPEFWNDPARGTIPMGWAFNPNLADRFGPGLAYTRKTKSSLDYFVAGDSGAGYLNPQYLVERPHSGLPSGLDIWQKHCTKYYRQWGITITGFIIEGNSPPMSREVIEAYKTFSPNGIVAIKLPAQWGVIWGMPYARLSADIGVGGSPGPAAKMVLDRIGGQKPEFYVFRTILWKPTDIKTLYELIKSSPKGADIEIVDPYTLMLLIKQHSEQNSKVKN
jgi:hypothetical protein